MVEEVKMPGLAGNNFNTDELSAEVVVEENKDLTYSGVDGQPAVMEEQSVLNQAAKAVKCTDKNLGKAKKVTTWQTKKGKADLFTPCGDKHEWKQWTEFVKHCNKFRCEREGCGFFKKCWAKCKNIDCKGCHVPGHKRW